MKGHMYVIMYVIADALAGAAPSGGGTSSHVVV